MIEIERDSLEHRVLEAIAIANEEHVLPGAAVIAWILEEPEDEVRRALSTLCEGRFVRPLDIGKPKA